MSIKAIAVALLGVVLAIGVPFALDGSAVFQALRDVKPGMLLVLAGLATVSGAARAGKLYLLLRRAGQAVFFGRTLAISLASDFAFLTTPAGVGGYVLNISLLRRAGSPSSAAVSVVAAEQALDLVFFAVCIPLCSLFALGAVTQTAGIVSARMYVAVALMGLFTAALWCGRRRIANLVENLVEVRAGHSRVGAFLVELRDQLSVIAKADPRQSRALLFLTSVQWISRYGALWWLLHESGQHLPFGFIVVLQAVALHLAQWTGIPGGGGSADLALVAMLGQWVPQSTMAAVLPLWRFATLYFPLILGAASFAALARIGLKGNA